MARTQTNEAVALLTDSALLVKHMLDITASYTGKRNIEHFRALCIEAFTCFLQHLPAAHHSPSWPPNSPYLLLQFTSQASNASDKWLKAPTQLLLWQ